MGADPVDAQESLVVDGQMGCHLRQGDIAEDDKGRHPGRVGQEGQRGRTSDYKILRRKRVPVHQNL